MSDHVSAVPGSASTDDQAVAAFDLYLSAYFDERSPDDVLRISPEHLEQTLKGEGITSPKAIVLCRRLTRDGVLTWQSHTVPAGHSLRDIIDGYPLWDYRSEPDTTVWLETTWTRWRGWLEGCRQRVQVPLPDAGGEGEGKELIAEATADSIRGSQDESGLASPLKDERPVAPTHEPGQREGVSVSDLTEAQRLILEAMLELEATGKEARQGQKAILEKAGVANPEPKNYSHAFARLRQLNLLDVQNAGRGGGTWLTEAGVALARELAERD